MTPRLGVTTAVTVAFLRFVLVRDHVTVSLGSGATCTAAAVAACELPFRLVAATEAMRNLPTSSRVTVYVLAA